MARHTTMTAIANPLVTSQRLLAFQQQCESLSRANDTMFKVSLMTQTAGVLLRLPQEVVATSIVVLQRFSIVAKSEELTSASSDADFSVNSALAKASAAAIYLTAKQSFYPLSPRSVINVFAILTSPVSSPLRFINPNGSGMTSAVSDPSTYFVSKGSYQMHCEKLFAFEKRILVELGFDTNFVGPHNLALTYLQALSINSTVFTERVLAHLNAALLSAQLLCLTHQPNALAVAAIYLTAREQGVTLVDEEVAWWEVFDVGREELGFLVLSLDSLQAFAEGSSVIDG